MGQNVFLRNLGNKYKFHGGALFRIDLGIPNAIETTELRSQIESDQEQKLDNCTRYKYLKLFIFQYWVTDEMSQFFVH